MRMWTYTEKVFFFFVRMWRKKWIPRGKADSEPELWDIYDILSGPTHDRPCRNYQFHKSDLLLLCVKHTQCTKQSVQLYLIIHKLRLSLSVFSSLTLLPLLLLFVYIIVADPLTCLPACILIFIFIFIFDTIEHYDSVHSGNQARNDFFSFLL